MPPETTLSSLTSGKMSSLLFTIILGPRNVPKCPCLHLLPLRALPGSGDEEEGMLKHTHTNTKCSKTAQKQRTAFSGSCPSPQLWESLTLGSSMSLPFLKGIIVSVEPRTASPEHLRSLWGSFSFSLSSLQRHQEEEREQDRDWGRRGRKESTGGGWGEHCLCLFSTV